MRRIFAPAAVAAVALSFALPTIALASPGDDGFDLGVAVGSVAKTPAAVEQFLSTLNPTAERMVIGGCKSYVAHPAEASSAYTVPFCQIAVATPAAKKPV
jgi:hypothetical protein